MYGNIRVAMEDFTVLVDYTVRKFCVQYVSQVFESECAKIMNSIPCMYHLCTHNVHKLEILITANTAKPKKTKTPQD